jgi:excisionase family DNA binding protein
VKNIQAPFRSSIDIEEDSPRLFAFEEPPRELRAVRVVVKIGQELLAVKDALEHGHFGSWLQGVFGWSERTAQNFMSVAKRFKSAIIAGLPIQPSAAYFRRRARLRGSSLGGSCPPFPPDLAFHVMVSITKSGKVGRVGSSWGIVSPRRTDVQKLRDYLRIAEAAEHLGVSPNTLRNWENAGKVVAVRHPVNGYRLFKRNDLDALLRQVEDMSREPAKG